MGARSRVQSYYREFAGRKNCCELYSSFVGVQPVNFAYLPIFNRFLPLLHAEQRRLG